MSKPVQVDKNDPVNPRPGMNRAWEDVGSMTIEAAVAVCFTVPGIEYVEIAKVVPAKPSGAKVGEIHAGNPNPEDVEQFIHTTWGPGIYVLSPIYRGHKIRSRNFAVGGEAAFAVSVKGVDGAGISGLADVDQEIANSVRRKSAVVTLRELSEMERKGEDMTPEQLKDILATVVDRVAARPAGPDPVAAVMEKQMAFIEKQLERETARADRFMEMLENRKTAAADPNTLLGLGAAILPLVGKLPSKSLTSILNGVMRFLRPQEAPPEGGWTPEQVMTILQTAGPMVQSLLPQVLDALRQGLAAATGQPAPPPTTAPPQPTPYVAPNPTQAAPGGAFVPLDLNAEEKMAMDLFFQFLTQHDFESAWATLGTTEKTLMLNLAVMELKESQSPMSLLPLVLRFDVRAAGQQGLLLEYLTWGKTVKKPEIEKEDEAADREEREERSRQNGKG
jgi:hypothetical protein